MSKRSKILLHCFLFCLLIIFLEGCSNNKIGEKSNMYSLDQFDSIIVGESTSRDVRNIVSNETLLVTSFGAVSEYPAADGQYIRIKYTGSDLIVSSIELVDREWETTEK